MPRPPANLLPLTIPDPALPEAEISRLASLANASPEEFQKAAGQAFRRLVVAGFQQLQAPRNWKEVATCVDLWRKLEGLDRADKASVIPQGLVGVMRSVSRRPVVDVESDEDEGMPGFE